MAGQGFAGEWLGQGHCAAPAAATQQTYVASLDLDNLDGLRNVGEYGKHWDEEEQEQAQHQQY